MPAYLIATVRGVNDRPGMETYWSRAGATFEGSGAKPLAVYTAFKLLEGTGPVDGIVAIEFPDMQATSRWYESAAYQAVKQYLAGAADIEVILVDGGVVASPEHRMPHTKGNVREPRRLRPSQNVGSSIS
jgi:uncharacterized protein (DUF1330 family)